MPLKWLSDTHIDADIAQVIAAAVAFVGAWLVWLGYVRERRAKRFELAAEQERELTTDPILRFAVMLLDWGDAMFPIPDGYREFIETPALNHDLDLLFEALDPKLTKTIRERREGMLYRQSFVTLFNYLERTVRFWKRGYVKLDDIPQTVWIAQQLVKWDYAGLRDYRADQWFLPAMDRWYKNVIGGQSLAVLAEELAAAGHHQARKADLARQNTPSQPDRYRRSENQGHG